MENNNKFNQSEYINKYKKEHYKRIVAEMPKEEAEEIEKFCQDMKIKKSAFATAAMLYMIHEGIPLDEFMRYKE